MLILTRRVGESLMIGDNVAVTVLGVKGKPGADWNRCPQGGGGSPPGNLRSDPGPGGGAACRTGEGWIRRCLLTAGAAGAASAGRRPTERESMVRTDVPAKPGNIR